MRRHRLLPLAGFTASWTLAASLCSAGAPAVDGDAYLLDPNGGTGNSLVLRPDGRPLISYVAQDSTDELRVFNCANENCSTGQFYSLATGELGSSTAIAIRLSGLPIIAYSDRSDGVESIMAFDCDNMECSSGTVRDFNTDDIGGPADIAVSETGNLLIVYGAVGGVELLKLVTCSDDRCAQSTLRVLDPTDFSGGHPSIILRQGGLPIIAYGGVESALSAYVCEDSECTTGDILVLDNQSQAGIVDMALGNNGFPIISYHDRIQQVLKVYACSRTDCNSGTIQDALDVAESGLSSSIAISGDGTPLVSYSDATKSQFKVLNCSDTTCTNGEIYVLDRPGSGRSGRSSLAVRSTGLPIMSYQDEVTDGLRVYSCANSHCALPGYKIAKSVIAGGGGASQGKKLTLTGSIGQPVTQSSTNSGYTLSGGFWAAGTDTDLIFESGFEGAEGKL